MEAVTLEDLDMGSREEVLRFLKGLWDTGSVPCPLCGRELELLHKKAKKDLSDWQCRSCGRKFLTIRLLYELNEQMPD